MHIHTTGMVIIYKYVWNFKIWSILFLKICFNVVIKCVITQVSCDSVGGTVIGQLVRV